MIEKIIARGTPGAGAAALDIANKLGLDTGGWCSDRDTIPDKYRLERLSAIGEATIVEKLVEAAEGTLLFLMGDEASALASPIRRAARRRQRPLLLMDLMKDSGFMASRQIAEWVTENRIRALYVEGVAAEAAIAVFASQVATVLEASLFLTMMETGITAPLPSVIERTPQFPVDTPPSTLDAALDHLEATLSLKDKATIANMAPGELATLHFSLGDYINRRFGIFTADSQLLTDCRRHSGRWGLAPEEAAAIIIRKLWERLRATYRIRVVK